MFISHNKVYLKRKD